MPNKKTSSGEGQRKEIYYAALVHNRKRQVILAYHKGINRSFGFE
jgi:hypothetical protein